METLLILILIKILLCDEYKITFTFKRVNHICIPKNQNYICFFCSDDSNCEILTVLLINEKGEIDTDYYSFIQSEDINERYKNFNYKTNLIQFSENKWAGMAAKSINSYNFGIVQLEENIFNYEKKYYLPSADSHFLNSILLKNGSVFYGYGTSKSVFLITYDVNDNIVYNNTIYVGISLTKRNSVNCIQFGINDEIGCFYDNNSLTYFFFENNRNNPFRIEEFDKSEGCKYLKINDDKVILCTLITKQEEDSNIYDYICTIGIHTLGNFVLGDIKTIYGNVKNINTTEASPLMLHNIDFVYIDNDKKILLIVAGETNGFFIGKFLLDDFIQIGGKYYVQIFTQINKKLIVRYILKHSEKLVSITFNEYNKNKSYIYLYTFPTCKDFTVYGIVDEILTIDFLNNNNEEIFTEIGIMSKDFELDLTLSNSELLEINNPYSKTIEFTTSSNSFTKYSLTYYIQNTLSEGKTFVSNLCEVNIFFCAPLCASCEEGKEKCLTCKENYGFKEVNDGNCILISSMPNYYEDTSTTPSIYKRCNNLCLTCNKGSDSESINCLSCINGYSLTENHNCILTKSMPSGYFLNEENNMFMRCENFPFLCTEDTKCDLNYPLLIVDNNQCVNSCDSSDCEICQENNMVQLGNYCSKKSKNDDNSYTLKIDNLDKSNLKKLINDNYDSLITDDILLIECEEAVVMLYDTSYSDSEIKELNSKYKLSTIDLGECQKILESKFPTPLTIIKFDIKESTFITPELTYYVYDNNGNEIDINLYCSGNSISITSPIINLNLFDYSTAELLSKDGYDVFDPNNTFFNSICTPFTNENGTDVILKDRQKNYYQEVNFCGTCLYNGINYTDQTVNCVCEVNEEMNINNEFIHDMETEFKKMFISETFYVYKCYKLVFQYKYFKKNYGCWIMIFLTFCHIIIYIYFCIDDLKKIKSALKKNSLPPPDEDNNIEEEKYHIDHENDEIESEQNFANPPFKKKNKNEFNNSENDIRKVKTKEYIFNKKKNQSSNILNKNYFEGIDDIKRGTHHNSIKSSNNNSYIYESNKKKEDKRLSKFFKKKSKIRTQESQPVIFNMNTNDNLNSQNSKKQFNNYNKKLNENELDYDIISYEEAERYDHRTSSVFYWDYLSDKQNIINIFVNNSILDMRHLKLDRYIIAISLDFFFNALFFTDNYISKKYKNYGTLSFFVGLPKTIFSNLTAFIICVLLDYLSNNKIEEIIKNEKYSEEFKLIAHKILTLYKCKLIIFFTLSTLIMIITWYFVSAFCAVYYNIQVDWILSGLESCAIGLIIPFITGIIITILWKMSLSYKKKNLYKVTKWLKGI